MRALFLTLIILAIVYAESSSASVHLPPYTLDQETSDTIVGVSEIGEAAADVGAAAYSVDKAVTAHK